MLKLDNLNPNLLNAEYAVRGPIVDRAQELERQGRKIIYCNIGNPQALKQKPLTYLRQVLALVEWPEILDRLEVGMRPKSRKAADSTPDLKAGANKVEINFDLQIPKDIVQKARAILHKLPHGTGAYTQSAGMPFIRQAVADFITKRDGIPSDPENIILTDGASKGVQSVILALLKNKNDGFMIPIPQYPLYSATIALYGGTQIGYYLDEENEWQLNEQILTDSIEKAKRNGINPVAIAVINPSNPTGSVLSYSNIVMIINFAKQHNLAIMADEVYQENIYHEKAAFHSFAKVMHELGEKEIPLFSFHSVSKGFLGECGHRGGYMEMRNLPDDVKAQFIKLQSISLCANVDGQLSTYLMVSPPQKGDESYDLYVRERDGILTDLKEKAHILAEGLNLVDGMKIEVPHGALYAFVRLELPMNSADKMTPEERYNYESKMDSDYCMALLEETGICVVPGSGFGQMPGTLHFRTTILPPKEEMKEVVEKMRKFHEEYKKKLLEK